MWRERARERKERAHRGCWEKIGTGSPFNLLINHANEILTGYSEAVLRGGRKALVLDYTLSMWRGGKKRSWNMLLNKVMGNFSACGSQAEPQLGWREWDVSVDMDGKRKEKKQTRTAIQNTYNIYYVFKLDVWIVSTDLGSVCVCGGGGATIIWTNGTIPNCTWCNQACDIIQFIMAVPTSYTSVPVSANLSMWQTKLLDIIVHLSLSWFETGQSQASQTARHTQ